MFLTFAKLGETEFLAGQGRIDDALALVSDALSDAEEFDHLKSPVLRRRADLLAQSSAAASEVAAAYRAAIDCARAQGAKYYELQASTSYAQWLNSQAVRSRRKLCSLKFMAGSRKVSTRPRSARLKPCSTN